ncbi:MAG: C39 family peptidase [Gemmatimonadales bacterium]|jgi:hypothetical protein
MATITIISAECASVGSILSVSGVLSGVVSTDACNGVGATLVLGPAETDGSLSFVHWDPCFGPGSFKVSGSHPSYIVYMEDGYGDGDYDDSVLSVQLITNCSYNVTRLSQGGASEWANDQYDSLEGKTISQKGCALTSLTMALNFAGLDIDPGQLNEWMVEAGSFNPKGHVLWADGARQQAGDTRLKWGHVPEGVTLGQLAQQLCAIGHPIILAVKGSSGEIGTHFVLATGVENGRIKIADPGHYDRTFLDHDAYDNEFEPRGYVKDPPGDISAVYLAVDNAYLLVTDPSFRQTGRRFNDVVVREIPQSAFYLDAIDDDVTGELDTDWTSAVSIIQPPEGDYIIILKATKPGTHLLQVRAYSPDGTRQQPMDIPVTLDAGEVQVLDLAYTASPIITAELDVKPGSFPNSINPRANGVIPVAILTSGGFDATEVDASTVEFGPGKATASRGRGHIEDVDGDGDLDMLLHFRTRDSGIQCGDDVVSLTGKTLSGATFEGSNSIETTGCD